MNHVCSNCGEALTGEFCSVCGQRRFRASDRRFSHLMGEAFDAVTDLDGRFWRSLRAAMLQPGRIARDYIDGRRTHWVSPIRMFLLANVLYFFMPALTDLSLPLHDQMRGDVYRDYAPALCEESTTAWKCRGGQSHSGWTAPFARARLDRAVAQARATNKEFSMSDFEVRYKASSDAIGKVLVILHVPFIGLALMVFAWRSRRYYAEHFVVALGLVSFLLLFVQLAMNPLAFLYVKVRSSLGLDAGMPALALWVLVLGSLAHFSLACRRCYGSRPAWALCQGIAAFVALSLASFYVYRAVQFLLALWLM